MQLKLYNVGDKYAFSVGRFSSIHHYILLTGLKSTYPSAWEAYRDAKKIGKSFHVAAIHNKKYAAEDLTQPLTMDISAEEMITDHYYELLNIISEKSEGIEDDPEKQDMIYKEIKSIVEELLKLKEEFKDKEDKVVNSIIAKFRELVSQKFPKQLSKDISEKKEKENEEKQSATSTVPPPEGVIPVPPIPTNEPSSAAPVAASRKKSIERYAELDFKNLDDESKREIISEYGDRACKAISKKHPGAICKINGLNLDIIDANNGSSIIRMAVNDNLNVNNIVPMGDISEIFPIYSPEFYQRYWKPIVESIGHFVVNDSVLFVTSNTSLPDIPKDLPSAFDIEGWDIPKKSKTFITLSFKGKDPMWDFENSMKKTAAIGSVEKTQYTEDDFIKGAPKRVECIDPNIKTLFGKIGDVVQVIPLETSIELDIDFGRSIVRLTSDQVKILDDL